MNTKTRNILRTGLACLCLALAGLTGQGSTSDQVLLEQAEKLTSDPLHSALSEALSAGNTDTALSLAHRMLCTEYIQRGLTALNRGELGEAAGDFERVLALDPNNHRARVELARTYFSMSQFTRSRAEFAQVLASDPPGSVRRNIQRFLDQMDGSFPPPRRWAAQVAMGVLYDSNANYGPASDLVKVRPIMLNGIAIIDQLSVVSGSQPQDTWGSYMQLSLYGETETKPKTWNLAGNVNYYQTWLEDAHDYEVQYLSTRGGPRYTGTRHVLDLPLRLEHVRRHDDALVNIAGVSPRLLYAASRTTQWTTWLDAEYRDYDDVDSLDSVFARTGQSVRHALGESGHALSAGLFGFGESADDDAYSNAGWEGFVGADAALPWRSLLMLRFEYRGMWFDEREVLAPESRRDDEFVSEVQWRKRLTQHWSIAAAYQYTRNNSTFDLYEYERHFTTLGVIGEL